MTRRAPSGPKLLEKQVAQQVRDFLRARGWRIVRTQFAFSPGSFSTGEPGMADDLGLFYADRDRAVALALWLEYKGPNDRRHCTCQPGTGKQCKVCRQLAWHQRERLRGATVWVVSDFDFFATLYEKHFGWLHSGEKAVGQLSLLGDL
jgi:hypothetical protein